MEEKQELDENEDKEVTTDPVEFDPSEIPDIDSKYRLILLAAQRAKQIQRGATPRVDVDPKKLKSTTIAMEEFRSDKVNFRFTKERN